MSASNLPAAYREVAIEFLNRGDGIITDDVAREVQIRYPDLYADSTTRLALQQAKAEIAKILKSLDEVEGGQSMLPGIDAMPSTLTIPAEGGFVHKATAFCTYAEGVQYLKVLDGNIDAATLERDAFAESLKQFAPLMEDEPSMTFLDAVRQMRGDAA